MTRFVDSLSFHLVQISPVRSLAAPDGLPAAAEIIGNSASFDRQTIADALIHTFLRRVVSLTTSGDIEGVHYILILMEGGSRLVRDVDQHGCWRRAVLRFVLAFSSESALVPQVLLSQYRVRDRPYPA